MHTTDSQVELFDVVDGNDTVIRQATRREVHGDPSLVHRVIIILVFRGGNVFLQKRSMTRDALPGLWTCSVAGHVHSGESYEEAAKRELTEELGIQPTRPFTRITEKVMSYPTETERTRFYRYDDDSDTPIALNTNEASEGNFFPLTKELISRIGTEMPATPNLLFMKETYLETMCG